MKIWFYIDQNLYITYPPFLFCFVHLSNAMLDPVLMALFGKATQIIFTRVELIEMQSEVS